MQVAVNLQSGDVVSRENLVVIDSSKNGLSSNWVAAEDHVPASERRGISTWKLPLAVCVSVKNLCGTIVSSVENVVIFSAKDRLGRKLVSSNDFVAACIPA